VEIRVFVHSCKVVHTTIFGNRSVFEVTDLAENNSERNIISTRKDNFLDTSVKEIL
jgi:hypothetical protein